MGSTITRQRITRPRYKPVERILQVACERSAAAEIHYEDPRGIVVIGRARFIELTADHILLDRPMYFDGDGPIPTAKPVTVHTAFGGSRYRFHSMIEDDSRWLRLNDHQEIPGIAMRRPAQLIDSQRRSHFRISLVAYDPINVTLAPAHPSISCACAVDARWVRAWAVDLSAGGMSVLTDASSMPQVAVGERFFLSFRLPGTHEGFCLLGCIRHTQLIQSNESLRLAIRFEPWDDLLFADQQERLGRFVAQHERRLLRRRKETEDKPGSGDALTMVSPPPMEESAKPHPDTAYPTERRRAARRRLKPSTGAAIHVGDHPSSIAATLLNLSEHGAACSIRHDAAHHLHRVEAVQLDLDLPQGRTLTIGGHVVSLTGGSDGQTLVGIEFIKDQRWEDVRAALRETIEDGAACAETPPPRRRWANP